MQSRGSPPITITLWDGSEVPPADGRPAIGRVRFGSRAALVDLALRPDPGLGNAYVDGRIELDGDVLSLLDAAFGSGTATPSRLHAWLAPISWLFRHTSLGQARENIRHHYDLGNDFYALWLDERMQYTCAFFPSPEASLETAQRAKLERVCRKLALRPGERVIEAGCGWGGLALHMAEHHGVTVRAFNISAEQIAYARERARERGLHHRVEFIEDNYRNIEGECDAFVSVGMLEHVGRSHYRTLSSVIDRTLAADGRGLIHSIGRARVQHMNRWLEQNIFPGAYIPSLKEMMAVFEPHRFAVLDVENLRRHYARTLEHWLDRFEKHASRVAADQGDEFVRLWRLYLASSAAAFRNGSCQLYQIVFAREGSDAIPWSRDDLALDRCADPPVPGGGNARGAL
jgi:cyclopropane-fatty-acyl-phospholipid synthase